MTPEELRSKINAEVIASLTRPKAKIITDHILSNCKEQAKERETKIK